MVKVRLCQATNVHRRVACTAKSMAWLRSMLRVTRNFLHESRAADFIFMGMGNNDVFHLCGIETKLLEAADNYILRVINALCVV
jgi:hypothetical protein